MRIDHGHHNRIHSSLTFMRIDHGHHNRIHSSLTFMRIDHGHHNRIHSSLTFMRIDHGHHNRIHSSLTFMRIDHGHHNRIHSSLTTVFCSDNGYVRKQPVAWKEYCADYWLRLQESMDGWTGCCDLTEILLKTALNPIHLYTLCPVQLCFNLELI